MNEAIRYVAELKHVREVSLLGTADLSFWMDALKNERLVPVEDHGKAQVLIVACASRFLSLHFAELSISVLVRRDEDGIEQEGAYLTQAFNSSRCYAFIERTVFSTPYSHAGVRVSPVLPAFARLFKHGELVFGAEMRAIARIKEREPLRVGNDGWEGPVFLPANNRRKNRLERLFFAKIRGHTTTYQFLDSLDAVTIKLSQDIEILRSLVESQFAGKEWAIRADATHAKSKTYDR